VLQLHSRSTEVLRKARWLLRHHPDVMLLADRGFANHELMVWLRNSQWHYAILPCDVLLHGTSRFPGQLARCTHRWERLAIVRSVCGWMERIVAILWWQRSKVQGLVGCHLMRRRVYKVGMDQMQVTL